MAQKNDKSKSLITKNKSKDKPDDIVKKIKKLNQIQSQFQTNLKLLENKPGI